MYIILFSNEMDKTTKINLLVNVATYFTEFVGATEYPSNASNYTNVTGNEGCYTDTDPPKTAIVTSKQHSYTVAVNFK